MFSLLMYALCLCLAFKGVEILQIALAATASHHSIGPASRRLLLRIGMASLVLTWALAGGLACWFTLKAWQFEADLQERQLIPVQPRSPFRQDLF